MPPKELSKIRMNFNPPENNLDGAESYEDGGYFKNVHNIKQKKGAALLKKQGRYLPVSVIPIAKENVLTGPILWHVWYIQRTGMGSRVQRG